jgi:hypothetical protein
MCGTHSSPQRFNPLQNNSRLKVHNFGVFTDLNEMRQLKMEGYMTVVPITFKTMATMAMVSPEGCDGIAINPHGESLVIQKAYIETIVGDLKKVDTEETAMTEPEELVAAEIEVNTEE